MARQLARFHRAEGLQSGLQVGKHLLGPGLVAFEVLVARQHLAVGRDQVKPLVLRRPLFLHAAEEVSRGILLFADHIEIQRNRNGVRGDKADDVVLAQRALTEPVGITSARAPADRRRKPRSTPAGLLPSPCGFPRSGRTSHGIFNQDVGCGNKVVSL